MNTPFKAIPDGGARTVYVRAVAVADLPEDIRDRMEGAEMEGAEVIYSVHAPDGQRLALVANRAMAFNLARAQDFVPVNVH